MKISSCSAILLLSSRNQIHECKNSDGIQRYNISVDSDDTSIVLSTKDPGLSRYAGSMDCRFQLNGKLDGMTVIVDFYNVMGEYGGIDIYDLTPLPWAYPGFIPSFDRTSSRSYPRAYRTYYTSNNVAVRFISEAFTLNDGLGEGRGFRIFVRCDGRSFAEPCVRSI